jgi:putative tryptophan/tyrosine transport system substrate-binding protein
MAIDIGKREFISALGGAVATMPFSISALSQIARIFRIGILSPGAPFDAGGGPSALAFLFGEFRKSLRELGYLEGQNLIVESRWADGIYEHLPSLAAELVGFKVDVIVTYGTPATIAAKRATATIPIVMAGIIDPVAVGLITNLARPGENLTGNSMMSPDLVDKQLEMLKEIVPEISRVAILANPANLGNTPQARHAQDVAPALGLKLQLLQATGPSEIDNAFVAMMNERVGGFIVLVDAELLDHRAQIAELAAKHHLPAVYGLSEHADAGGLVSYGPNRLFLFHHAATFVDKIFRGSRPGDLPVEQPTEFELVVNMKTSERLGVKIPASIIVRADRLIE